MAKHSAEFKLEVVKYYLEKTNNIYVCGRNSVFARATKKYLINIQPTF